MAALHPLAVLGGRLPDTAIGGPVRWVSPKWDCVDPEKDVKAERLQVEAGFKSRRQVILEMGEGPDRVADEIAADTFTPTTSTQADGTASP